MAKILVADDEFSHISLVEKILKREGHTVISVNNGMQALNKLKTENPDLAILDILMPDLDGASLLYELKMGYKENKIPIIFVSGLVNIDSKSYRSMENVYFLPKPIILKEFLATVNEALNNKNRSVTLAA